MKSNRPVAFARSGAMVIFGAVADTATVPVRSLVRVSGLPASSTKLARTRIRVPSSASVSV